MIDFTTKRVLTFDCYGTLIDWETGLLAALQPILADHGTTLDSEHLLTLYGELESTAEQGSYTPYRQLLMMVLSRLGERLGFVPSKLEEARFADSVGDWPPFADAPAALAALRRRFRLAIISNVDDDLFARTNERLGVVFDWIVTAQQVGSYKPSPNNFQRPWRASACRKAKSSTSPRVFFTTTCRQSNSVLRPSGSTGAMARQAPVPPHMPTRSLTWRYGTLRHWYGCPEPRRRESCCLYHSFTVIEYQSRRGRRPAERATEWNELYRLEALRRYMARKLIGFVDVRGTDAGMPVTILNRSDDAPALLITAGIYGGEYPSIEAASRLSVALEPVEMSGQIILCPLVSLEAFHARQQYVLPGRWQERQPPLGTVLERIAHTVVNQAATGFLWGRRRPELAATWT